MPDSQGAARAWTDSQTIEQLREQVGVATAHYRSLFESFDDAVMVTDDRSRYLDVNPAATVLLGYTREELLRMQVADVVGAGPGWTEDEFGRFLREGHWRGELEVRRKDGNYRSVESNASVVLLPSERVYVAILRDVTARRQAEREREKLLLREQAARTEAEAAIRLRDDVMTTVTHDLGNPLTGIKGYVQLLKRQIAKANVDLPPPAVHSLDQIENLTAQMKGVLETVSDLAYLQIGVRPRVSLQPTDLVAVARRVVEQQQLPADTYSIAVEANVDRLVGSWDQPRLERILDNLLSNAIKYSPLGGNITVGIRPDVKEHQAGALLVVRDHGMGIPATDLPYVFDLRRRGGNVPRWIAGEGIGLASARQLVELHGGTISVESQEGDGTTMIVRLPLVVPDLNDDVGRP